MKYLRDFLENLFQLVADSYVVHAATESFLKHNATKYFYVYDHVNRNSFAEFEPNIVQTGGFNVLDSNIYRLF